MSAFAVFPMFLSTTHRLNGVTMRPGSPSHPSFDSPARPGAMDSFSCPFGVCTSGSPVASRFEMTQ